MTAYKQETYKVYFINPIGNELVNFSSDLNASTNEDPNVQLKEKTDVATRYSKAPPIYQDDTIADVKKKIILDADKNITFDEIYLFGICQHKINIKNIYRLLTNNGAREISRPVMNAFLVNLVIDDALLQKTIAELPNKPVYTYDDLLLLNIDGKTIKMKTPLSQKIRNHIYTVNPYDNVDKLTAGHIDAMSDDLTTINESLLLDFPPLVENTIYAVLARHLLTQDAFEHPTKIYFPYLAKENISTLGDFQRAEETLLTKTRALFTEYLANKYSTLSLFYSLKKTKLPNIPVTHLIKNIKLNIYSNEKIKLPLEYIFKQIHATQEIPLIKYNPGLRRDKIIRLYSESQTKKGEKIPYLQKGTIFKVLKQLTHQRGIGFYHKHILVNIYENGIIGVESVYEKNDGLTIIAIEDAMRSVVNPVLDEVRRIVEQSGYTIGSFENLFQENIDILNIDYQMTFSVKKNIVLSNYLSCIGYLFNIISGDVNKQSGAALRYKRVSNFNEMSSQQAFIVEQVNLGKNKEDIIDGLVSNFKLSEEKANTLFVGFLNEINVEQGLREGKKTKIKENPGFAVSMTMEKLSNNLVVDISNINNIYYLNTVPMFVSGVVQLTQSPLSKIPNAKALCKKTKLVEEKPIIEEIVPERKEEATIFRVDANNNANEEADDFLDMLLNDNANNNENNNENNNADPNENLNESISENIISTIQEKVENNINKKETPKVEENNSINKEENNINVGENNINVGENNINVGENIEENNINIGENNINVGENNINVGENNINVGENINIGENNINVGENINIEGALSKGGMPPSNSSNSNSNSNEDNIVQDITGMPLSNPNPFSARMESRDPTLFLKDKQGKFSAYSRMCPSNVRRQPVILTAAEKAKIDKEHPGSYEHAIKYGSSPDKQHWYICPRYWCLTKNVSLTKEQIDAGECGGKDAIIPFGAKKVPPGKQIFEFYAKSEHDKGNGSYIQHYPGFIPGSKHPDGKCIPCCFKSWDAPEQVRRRAACSGDEAAVKAAPKKVPHRKKVPTKKPEEKKVEKEPKKIIKPEKKKKSVKKETKLKIVSESSESSDSSNSNASLSSVSLKNSVSPQRVRSNEPEEYIKGPEKFPLEQNRWGYLPPEIASFLDTENEKCQVSATNMDIKQNHPCYLRHGVENDPNQSFVGCIADLYVEYIKEIGIPTIREMKQVIASAISLDSFPGFQNGNLVELFYNPEWDGSIDSYADSELFKDTDTTDPAAVLVLERIISAYENFKLFLADDSAVIDHEYLWDIVTTPNPKLFPGGLNLIILNVPHDDATNNVEVLCPTNAYSSQFFDPRKQSLLLIRKESGNNFFFEPIYLYTNNLTKIVYTKTFSEYGKLLPNMKQTLMTIKKYLNDSCQPLKSQPNVYKFKSSVKLETLETEFKNIGGKISSYVLNYNGKIVGVYGSHKGKTGVLPCLPTGNSKGKDKKKTHFVDDDAILRSYDHTIAFLSSVKKANGKIPCDPKIRVVDDEHIIGILTETNQFVGVNPPLPLTEERENESELPIVRESSYVNFDKRISNYKNTSYNSERDLYIRNIRFEREFYSVFRNIVRIALTSSVKEKEAIIEIYIDYKVGLGNTNKDIEMRQKDYTAHIENMVQLLKSISENKVKFVNYSKDDLENIAKSKISLCNNSCNEEKKPFCEKHGTSGNCLFLIPSENLINQNNNAEFYYLRLADEILRNDRIRQFIMEPDQVLFLTSVPYMLNENEIIILNSLLTQEYFLNKRPYKKNIFLKHDTFNTVEPALTEPYSSKIEIVEDSKNAHYVSSCFEGYENIKGKGKESWKVLFGPEFSALTPHATPNCTIDLLTMALHEKGLKNDIDTESLKKTLILEYNRLFEAGHKEQIMKILVSQGKKNLIKSIESDKSRLLEQITSVTYYFTLLDYWILANYHKLNIVFLTSTKFTENNSNSLATSTDYAKKFLIIKLPGTKEDVVPEYKIYTNNPKEPVLLCDIPRDAENYIQKTPYLSLEEMIAKFKPKKYVKKKKLLIQND